MRNHDQLAFDLSQTRDEADLVAGDDKRRVLDSLFDSVRSYRSGAMFREFMGFVGRFRSYAPYNAALIYAQMPGARFVAPASRWSKQYKRAIRNGARPLVVLQPMGPVMLVFDVSDTEPMPDAPPLPDLATQPFAVRTGTLGDELTKLTQNARRDGVAIAQSFSGSQHAGSIRSAKAGRTLKVNTGRQLVEVPMRYELEHNHHLSPEAAYMTVVHELAHLYCGHLGTPNPKWWPDRRNLVKNAREFEAESVTHLVGQRLGIDGGSDSYLAGYLDASGDIPAFSIDLVITVTGLIERMSKELLGLRKAQ